MIRELKIESEHFKPGETLVHGASEYTHVTISYDISGERDSVDSNIASAMEKDPHLTKVDCVNTTLYWQFKLGSSGQSKECLVSEAKSTLEEKLQEIFHGEDGLGGAKVTAFCMVGNLRAFAFNIA
ncbi:MAG: hypothetical protein GKR94_09980 [Gammaproteobacteria bacterium]|nr:hypothetical protein [Gammaproteobacteria bacterium]